MSVSFKRTITLSFIKACCSRFAEKQCANNTWDLNQLYKSNCYTQKMLSWPQNSNQTWNTCDSDEKGDDLGKCTALGITAHPHSLKFTLLRHSIGFGDWFLVPREVELKLPPPQTGGTHLVSKRYLVTFLLAHSPTWSSLATQQISVFCNECVQQGTLGDSNLYDPYLASQLRLLCFFPSPWEDFPPTAGSGQCGSLVLQLRQMVKFKGEKPQLFVKLPLDSSGMVGADLFIFTCLPCVLAYREWLTAFAKCILRWLGYRLNKTKMALSLNHVKRM